MSATVSLPPDVATYLARVRGALADLPAEERDELLADVEASLLEAAADSVEPLEQRLGPPARFASELRAAAGLEVPPASKPDRFEQLRALATRVAPMARELAPIWWLARAYVAVAIVTLIAGDDWWTHPVVPDLLGPEIGVLTLLVAVIGSVWLGLRRSAFPRRPLAVLNVALVVAAVPVAVHATSMSERQIVTVYEQPPVAGELTHMGEPITNVYPYSRDGRLLFDVLLYDQLGRPIEVGAVDPAMDPFRRRVQTKSGRDLRNAFPIRYVEPGTQRVAEPKAGPRVRVPRIATPPLR